MITIDYILTSIENYGFDKITQVVSRRDIRILRNLANLIKSSDFITENQGNLLIKILKENRKSLGFLDTDIHSVLENPQWSRLFRKVHDIKKITIHQANDEKFLKIECDFNFELKKSFADTFKNADGNVSVVNNKIHLLPLTEKNLVLVVSMFHPENFEISEEILEFFATINTWSKSEFFSKFELQTIDNKKIIERLHEEGVLEDNTDDQLLMDRKIRYQYQFFPEVKYLGLTNYIADRENSKIWVDPKMHEFDNLVDSLVSLKKFPILLIFNGHNEYECIKQLDAVSQTLCKRNLTDDVGVYFRFQNIGKGKDFNQRIADNQFNAPLNVNTKIAGLINGKLPKFFLKTDWRPNSVISFTNNLNHNKTSVYCNNCDLIVYYTDKMPFAVEQ